MDGKGGHPLDNDRLLGGLYGLLVGDALGVPYEFKKPSALPPRELIDMTPPAGFSRSHPRVPPGYWSDDGAQALCLLASLLFHERLDLEDLGRRFRNWYRHGYLAAGGLVFDIGIQTSKALDRLDQGVPAHESGPGGEWDNGNGSLMRVLPLALWHRGSDRQLFQDACRQSLVTHGHPRSQICCGLYCLWARAELRAAIGAWQIAVESVRSILRGQPTWLAELEEHIQPDKPPGGDGSGYVVDCLHSARLALEERTFSGVARLAISLGNDTDTTAAVACGIAGIRFGLSAIPEQWRTSLPDLEILEQLAATLAARSEPMDG